MPLANVALTDTFDTWRTRTNQIIVLSDGNETRSIAAFDKANTAGTDAISAFGTANAAFGKANTANTDAIAAFTQANTAGTNAINAYGTANAAFGKANTAGTDAGAAFGQANTARTHANSAFAAANAAFNAANTISLDPVYTGNIIATGPANTVVIKPSSSATVANTIYIDNLGQVGFGGLPFDGSYGYSTPQNKILYYGNNANSITGTFVETVFDLYNAPGSGGIYIETFYNSVAAGSIDINNTGISIGSNSKIVLTPTGLVPNVGIGITNPAYKLDVGGSVNAAALLINGTPVSGAISLTTDDTTNDSYYITFSSANTGSVESINVANALYFNPSTGTLSATIFNSLSDETLKKDVKTIENALNKVDSVRGVSFRWKTNDQPSLGVIAQEIEKIAPELITEMDGIKNVNYDGIIGILIESIKDLKARVEKLENNG